MDKAKLRSIYLNKRKRLSRREVLEKSSLILDRLKELQNVIKYERFLIYMPINNEVLTTEIIESLDSKGRGVYLPVLYDGLYKICKFRVGDDLIEGPHRILQPASGRFIKSSEIEVAIVPGLAFSKDGARLGYGKGVFDKLLLGSGAIKIGLAYEFQIVNKLPQEKHDMKMDFVITEKKIYRKKVT